MKAKQGTIERRQDQRYQAMDRALAMVSQPSTNLPYHIIDISRRGMAFRYLGNKMQDGNITELNLCYNDTLCVKNIAVSSVADQWTGSDLTDIRRNCLVFKDLSETQQEQLDQYIKLYTTDYPH